MTLAVLLTTLWTFGYLGAGFTLVALLLTLRHHQQSHRARAVPSRNQAGTTERPLPPISILIPCEGAEAGLEANLRSHLTVPYPAPRQVIFAAPSPEDASSRVIEALLREALPPGVTAEVVYSHRAPAALNRKMRHLAVAEGRIQNPVVVAADSDTRLEPETLLTLVRALLADDVHGLAFAPPQFPAGQRAGEALLSFGFAASPHAFHSLAALSAFIGDDIPVVGSLLAIRTESLKAAGGYSRLGGHIGDDLELSRRVAGLKQKVVTAPCTVPCPEPDLDVRGLFTKVHRWITVGASYGRWRLLSYPFLLAPLPLLLLLSGAVVGVSWLAGGLPPASMLVKEGLPDPLVSLMPVLLQWSGLPLAGTVVLRLLFAWTVGPALYRRSPRLTDPVLLLSWEVGLVLACVLAAVHPVVTWRGRKLLVRPGGGMLSLFEPLRPQMPELPARKGIFNSLVLAPYLEHMVRGGFDGVYVRGLEPLKTLTQGRPLILAANHCSFWDGLLACLLHQDVLPHDFYIFMEDTQLRRYPFMRKAGAFSINRKHIRSAVASLKYAEELLSDPDRAVWIFPQGQWRPEDVRPLKLEAGVGHLARSRPDALVLPVSFHYAFRSGPRPSVFIELGTPLAPPTCSDDVPAFMERLEERLVEQLEQSKRVLTATPLEHVPEGFVAILTGRPGVAECWDRFREAIGLQVRAVRPRLP